MKLLKSIVEWFKSLAWEDHAEALEKTEEITQSTKHHPYNQNNN